MGQTLQHAVGVALVIIVLSLAVQSCIKITREGYTAEDKVNYPKLGAEAFAEADAYAAELEEASILLPADNKVSVRVMEALERIASVNEPDTGSVGGGFFNEYGEFQYFDEAQITARVVVQDKPLATTFSNGRLYLSSGLVDPELPAAAKTEGELLGVLAHEFVHLRDGHLLLQWMMLEARGRELRQRFLSGLTRGVPGVSYDYAPGAT